MLDTRIALLLAAQIKRATVPCSHWSDPPAPPVCVSSCIALQLLILSCINICPVCHIDTLWQSSTCRLLWVFRLVRVDDVAPEHPDDAHHHLPHHRLPPSHSLLNLCILPPNSSRQVQHCTTLSKKFSTTKFPGLGSSRFLLPHWLLLRTFPPFTTPSWALPS